MKILKICSLNYYNIVSSFYRRNLWIRDLPYQEHKAVLLNFAPVHLNRFSEYMNDLGHECDEIVIDLESLQKQWAKEHGVPCPEGGWHLEILLNQIEFYKPDILYLQDISAIPPALRRRLKNYYPFIKGIVVYRGFPVFQEGLEDIDLLLTGAHNLLEAYNKKGISARFLPHAFEEQVLEQIDNWKTPYSKTHSEFAFLGYSGYGGHGVHHIERFQFLQRLLRETPLRCWLAENAKAANEELTDSTGSLLEQFPEQCENGLMGLDMFHVLRNSKVVFNKHSSAHPGQVENMRLFEATGVGSCLLTDYGENLDSLFEIDREIVAYNSYDECVEKLNYLLENPNEREQIAQAGQKRTLKEHTWKHRAAKVDHYLKEIF